MLARLSQAKRRFHTHVSKALSNNRLHIQNWIIAPARRLERNQEHSLQTQTNLISGCQSDTLLFLSWEMVQGKLEPCRWSVGSPTHSQGQGLLRGAGALQDGGHCLQKDTTASLCCHREIFSASERIYGWAARGELPLMKRSREGGCRVRFMRVCRQGGGSPRVLIHDQRCTHSWKMTKWLKMQGNIWDQFSEEEGFSWNGIKGISKSSQSMEMQWQERGTSLLLKIAEIAQQNWYLCWRAVAKLKGKTNFKQDVAIPVPLRKTQSKAHQVVLLPAFEFVTSSW